MLCGVLEKRLNTHGYFQSKLVPGLWSHEWRPIQFTLVVDDFGVKYVGKEHAEHLQAVIAKYYKMSTNWTGTRYIGITLDWDYANKKVHLSMPGYVAKALKQFQHHKPSTPQHAPFPCAPIKYGAKKQYAKTESTAAPLNKKDKKFVQKVCGKFLFLSRAVDPTLLCLTTPSNCSTISPRKKMQFSLTMAAKWYWQYTVTPATSTNPRLAVEQVDISFCPTMQKCHQTMELF